ncbi:MAG: hypothetical protein ACK4NU_13185 [Brevundimonas sp.]
MAVEKVIETMFNDFDRFKDVILQLYIDHRETMDNYLSKSNNTEEKVKMILELIYSKLYFLEEKMRNLADEYVNNSKQYRKFLELKEYLLNKEWR